MTWDYAKLKTEVTKFAMRAGDAEFEDSAETFIGLAEAALNRKLPLREMCVNASLTGVIGSREISLPSDYFEPYAMWLTTYGDERELAPAIREQLPVCLSNSEPTAWAIDGSNIVFDCRCDRAHSFTFRYRKKFALSDSETTNWLLANHPDVYLAAALVWGGVFMRDTAEAAPWKMILDDAVNDLAWTEARSIAIAPLTVDAALATRGGFNIYTG